MCPGGALKPCDQKIVEALNTTLPFGPGYTVAAYRVAASPLFDVGPSDTTSSPAIFAGSPWNSQPTSPGIASPFFIPVPLKTQWSGRVHTQSPEPLNGDTVCAPISVASFGASS